MSFIHCKHYNGRDLFMPGSEGKCRAGVDPIYSFCGGDRTGWVRKVPCLRTNETEAICPAAEYPTMEEEEQRQREFQEHSDRFFAALVKVRPAIVAEHERTGLWSGSLTCPQCSKPLHWSMSQSNSHVHARCETDNCIAWME